MQEKNLKQELINKVLSAFYTPEELAFIHEKALSLLNKDKTIQANNGVIEFTEKELNIMPKNIKKLLLIDKKRCRLRTRKSGKNSITYEIRFRKDGYNICACGKTIDIAKANFISKCKNAISTNIVTNTVPTTFNDFAMFYFENFRKEKVSNATMRTDMTRYNKYLLPHFKQMPLKNITPTNCKTLLDKVKSEGKGKTTDELHSLLNVIFKSAMAHSIIERNPLDVVLHISHQRQSGKALTKEEEQRLKIALKGSQYITSFMVLLYTGLRPNELKTAKIQGDFIVAQNSKRKNKKVEYKRIPILNALRPFLDAKFVAPTLDTLRRHFNNILPNHILYDLRTTFYTRCDEYGVSPAARDEFVGHSNGALTNAYRSLSDDFLLKESKKLDKWL